MPRGGRDLNAAVGAETALRALDKLAADPETAAIVMISKPPEPAIAERVLDRAMETGKPVVVDFVGVAPEAIARPGIHAAGTLAEAAALAVAIETGNTPMSEFAVRPIPDGSAIPGAKRRYLRGLYSGGTLGYEAMVLLGEQLGAIRSDSPLGAAIERLDGLDVKPLMTHALHMGDEVHNRNVADTAKPGVITDCPNLDRAAAGETGTRFVPG